MLVKPFFSFGCFGLVTYFFVAAWVLHSNLYVFHSRIRESANY